MVLIFSSPWRSTISSNATKQSLSSCINCSGLMCLEIAVNPLKSVNKTLTKSYFRGVAAPTSRNSFAVSAGKILSNKASDLAFSCWIISRFFSISDFWDSISMFFCANRLLARRANKSPAKINPKITATKPPKPYTNWRKAACLSISSCAISCCRVSSSLSLLSKSISLRRCFSSAAFCAKARLCSASFRLSSAISRSCFSASSCCAVKRKVCCVWKASSSLFLRLASCISCSWRSKISSLSRFSASNFKADSDSSNFSFSKLSWFIFKSWISWLEIKILISFSALSSKYCCCKRLCWRKRSSNKNESRSAKCCL